MDCLKDKQTKQYSALSRYSTFYLFYHTLDDKFIYEKTKHLDKNSAFSAHTVVQTDTLDSLALKYYGRPDYYWIIADFNDINDPFIDLHKNFKVIKIPSLGQLRFGDGR
jgi:nucleoid-associated protein YgaU